MKPFYIFLLTILAAATANAQTTYTWDGSAGTLWTDQNNWTPVRTAPAATDILEFNTGGTVSPTGVITQTIGKLLVSNNTNLSLSGSGVVNTLTIGNGTGDDLVISSGTLTQNASLEVIALAASATADISGTYRNLGTFNISAGSIVVSVNGNLDNRATITGATAATVLVKNGGTYFHGVNGGTVPTLTWEDGSALNLSGMTSTYPGGMTQTFEKLVFSGALTASLTMSGNISCEDLTISTTGAFELRLTNDASDRVITVSRDFSMTSGTLVLVSDAGDGTLNVTRNASITGGTLRVKDGAGAARFNVTGDYSQSAGTLDLWASSGTSNAIATVTGNFSLSGGTIDLCGTNFESGALNVAGDFSLTAGTITETGTLCSGIITFNGTEPQTYVSGGNINNTVHLVVSSGAILQMDAAGTTVGGDDFTLSSGGTLGIRAVDGIVTTGAAGNIRSGGTRAFSAGAHYIYNGSANQAVGTGFPTNLTGSLTIDNANTVTLGLTRTVSAGGAVYLTNGTFAASTTLTMATGSTINRSGGAMTGTIAGTGAYTAVYTGNSKTSGPELSGSALANITLNTNASQVVTLNQAKTITGALTLTNGILTTTASNLLTIGTAGSASAGSNTSFVNGPLAKNTNTVANFTFPVGVIGGGIRPIGVTPTTTNATTFTASFTNVSPKTAYAGATFAAGINQISNCEYWILDRSVAGTPSPATVTLSWSANSCNGAGYVGNPVTLKVARHDGGTPGVWTDAGYSGSTGTSPYSSGTVTSGVLNTFSPFTLGTGNSSQNPLPVMFADVMAYSKNAGVQVEWSNLTEREITGYIVERSSNGSTFTEIDRKAPRSNSDGKESYSYFDASPVNGANFYRIRVNEMHGKVIYSKVLRVDMGSSKQSFGLYPNPVTGRQFTVSLNGMSQGQYSLKVVNAVGQPVFETKINNQGSATTQTLELPASVKSGVYTSILTGTDYRETKLFIVQ